MFSDRLEALLREATPGPWWVEHSDGRKNASLCANLAEGDKIQIGCLWKHWKHRTQPEDADLLVYLRNHASALVKVVEAARKRNSLAYDERQTRRELHDALAALDGERDG